MKENTNEGTYIWHRLSGKYSSKDKELGTSGPKSYCDRNNFVEKGWKLEFKVEKKTEEERMGKEEERMEEKRMKKKQEEISQEAYDLVEAVETVDTVFYLENRLDTAKKRLVQHIKRLGARYGYRYSTNQQTMDNLDKNGNEATTIASLVKYYNTLYEKSHENKRKAVDHENEAAALRQKATNDDLEMERVKNQIARKRKWEREPEESHSPDVKRRKFLTGGALKVYESMIMQGDCARMVQMGPDPDPAVPMAETTPRRSFQTESTPHVYRNQFWHKDNRQNIDSLTNSKATTGHWPFYLKSPTRATGAESPTGGDITDFKMDYATSIVHGTDSKSFHMQTSSGPIGSRTGSPSVEDAGSACSDRSETPKLIIDEEAEGGLEDGEIEEENDEKPLGHTTVKPMEILRDKTIGNGSRTPTKHYRIPLLETPKKQCIIEAEMEWKSHKVLDTSSTITTPMGTELHHANNIHKPYKPYIHSEKASPTIVEPIAKQTRLPLHNYRTLPPGTATKEHLIGKQLETQKPLDTGLHPQVQPFVTKQYSIPLKKLTTPPCPSVSAMKQKHHASGGYVKLSKPKQSPLNGDGNYHGSYKKKQRDSDKKVESAKERACRNYDEKHMERMVMMDSKMGKNDHRQKKNGTCKRKTPTKKKETKLMKKARATAIWHSGNHKHKSGTVGSRHM